MISWFHKFRGVNGFIVSWVSWCKWFHGLHRFPGVNGFMVS